MGMIGGLIGSAGGAGGTGFSGPSSAGIAGVTNPADLEQAQKQNQEAMAAQQALLQSLQGQGGLQNQSNVYGQLQNIAAGQGPNPAQAMLNQSTAQNVANQAALMAGQRGASSNVGLLARQAAMQGANTQQQAANQAAVLQANQSLNALSAAGNMANTMAGNQIGQVNANQSARQAAQNAQMNAQAGVNAANVGMQSNVNNVSGQLANTTLQGQQGLMGGIMNMAGSAMGMGGMAEGGEVEEPPKPDEFKTADTPAPEASPELHVEIPQFTQSNPGADAMRNAGKSKDGGGGSGLSSIMKMAAMAAEGGTVTAAAKPGPRSNIGKLLQSYSTATPNFGNPGANAIYQGMGKLGEGIGTMMKNRPAAPSAGPTGDDSRASDTNQQQTDKRIPFAKGGKVPALVSPGEQYLPPKDVKKVVQEGKNPLSVGERIPGTPKVPGNSYANDTVPKTLEAGGIVIPNSVMQSRNPHFEAMKFVHAHIAKNRSRLPKKGK